MTSINLFQLHLTLLDRYSQGVLRQCLPKFLFSKFLSLSDKYVHLHNNKSDLWMQTEPFLSNERIYFTWICYLSPHAICNDFLSCCANKISMRLGRKTLIQTQHARILYMRKELSVNDDILSKYIMILSHLARSDTRFVVTTLCSLLDVVYCVFSAIRHE